MSKDTAILVAMALARVALHAATNGQYGFHRDELATVDDARHLAWGYVAYPPVTPFVARVALELFGASLTGVRLFAALAQGAALVLTGWMARALGGGRRAQVIAALGVAIATLSFGAGTMFQYVAFDFLWWVAAAYLTIRLLQTDDPRWWLGIGAVIGLGMLTKYTSGFWTAGIVAGVLFTGARRHLRSPWLWAGALLSMLMFLPNLIWQIQHQFISLDFLNSIHARDVRIGRTDGFLPRQLLVGANPFTVPLWLAGLYYYFFAREGRRFRAVGWMYAVPLALFVIAKGRDYYMAPAYPMLLAAGGVTAERWLASLRPARARLVEGAAWVAWSAGAVLVCAVLLPVAPVGSAWWNFANNINGDLREEIGWPEMAAAVARIRDSLPAGDRAHLGILTGNYGEAGAINLYGPALGLPPAISGTNSYWLRGYPEPPPETLIAIGFPREALEQMFEACEFAGPITNRYGVKNEETTRYPGYFVCRRLRKSWPDFWKTFRRFG